jgi:hypothetical protein
MYKGDTELLTLGHGRAVWLASTASSLCCFELEFERCLIGAEFLMTFRVQRVRNVLFDLSVSTTGESV